jgi:hypothetical protein
VDKIKDSDLKSVSSKLWALKGAERRLLGSRAESIPPRQVESPSIPGPRSLLHCSSQQSANATLESVSLCVQMKS